MEQEKKEPKQKNDSSALEKRFDYVQYEWGFVMAKDREQASEKIFLREGITEKSQFLALESLPDRTVMPQQTPEEVIEMEKELKGAVVWSIEDFETLAQELEEEAGKPLFDRTLFAEYLYEMIENHDADYGITWASVRYYLENYCKLPTVS